MFWQIFGIFVIFSLVRKILDQKVNFWRFLKNAVFSKISDYLNRFLVKFSSENALPYSYQVTTKLFFFHKTLQNLDSGTIANINTMKDDIVPFYSKRLKKSQSRMC